MKTSCRRTTAPPCPGLRGALVPLRGEWHSAARSGAGAGVRGQSWPARTCTGGSRHITHTESPKSAPEPAVQQPRTGAASPPVLETPGPVLSLPSRGSVHRRGHPSRFRLASCQTAPHLGFLPTGSPHHVTSPVAVPPTELSPPHQASGTCSGAWRLRLSSSASWELHPLQLRPPLGHTLHSARHPGPPACPDPATLGLDAEAAAVAKAALVPRPPLPSQPPSCCATAPGTPACPAQPPARLTVPPCPPILHGPFRPTRTFTWLQPTERL